MSGTPVSVAFPSYNQGAYLKAALESVLQQDYHPLEIVISDDASEDDSDAIIQATLAAYAGPHRVYYHRNPRRLGLENYNQLMAMARGEFVVVAHADDIALPQRVSRLVAAREAHGVSLVSSNALLMDVQGRGRGWLQPPQQTAHIDAASLVSQGWRPVHHGATLAWERAVFDAFGPLEGRRSAVSSDWILPFRAALLDGVHYCPEPLLQLRIHDQSRGQRYLHHQTHDEAAQQEVTLANRLAQYGYMRHTLGAFCHQRGNTATWEALMAQLDAAVLETADHWAQVRNGLMQTGLRVHWQAPT